MNQLAMYGKMSNFPQQVRMRIDWTDGKVRRFLKGRSRGAMSPYFIVLY